jgi:hypothetical protein
MDSNTIYSLTEYAHISEMQDDLRRKLGESVRRDVGRMDSLRTSILGMVVAENYARAKEEMEAYVTFKDAYPVFQERAARYVQHCAELIQAIDTKRNFPGLATLSLAKQQEIHEKVLRHFEDLKQYLRQVEKLERESKLDDVRSTVWVMRALCYATVLVLMTAFFQDLRSGAFSSFVPVINSFVDYLSLWIANLIKF